MNLNTQNVLVSRTLDGVLVLFQLDNTLTMDVIGGEKYGVKTPSKNYMPDPKCCQVKISQHLKNVYFQCVKQCSYGPIK